MLESPGATARALRAQPSPAPVATPQALPVDQAELTAPIPPAPLASAPAEPAKTSAPSTGHPSPLVAAIIVLFALGGFVLYQCGLTRAKNCGHTSMLVLIGSTFGLAGFWMGGFAVQTGGIGDAHAALPLPVPAAQQGALDHELGLMAGGHHWGLMGSAGFFLMTDGATRDDIAALFLVQAVLLALAVGAALGAALERGRLLAMAVIAFLTGAVIYPLIANWIWGGGWLAELGREFGFGHGVTDLAGAGVVHETAGALALAIAVVLGPRHGRFERNRATGIPGHNVPFTILGALVLLVALVASNALTVGIDTSAATPGGPALANVLLGALGGVILTTFLSAGRAQRATPARLCRGLIGGAVSICGGSALFDSWAAFLTGALAGLLVEGVVRLMEGRGIDDPANTTAIHGMAGAWGLLAVGLFANGSGGRGMNDVAAPIRGLFFGGSWHQLAAQGIGCGVIFVVVFTIGWMALQVVQKILGNRVKVAEELQGLDWTQVGALGYQPDVESEDELPP